MKMAKNQTVVENLARLRISKTKSGPSSASNEYLRYIYGEKIPKKELLRRNYIKTELDKKSQQLRKDTAAKKIQRKLMLQDNVFHKTFPSRYAIHLGGRVYDARSLSKWLKTHHTLPRPFNKLKLSNANRERVQRYDRRKFIHSGKRMFDLNSNEFHALSPEQKRRRIRDATLYLNYVG